MQFSSHPRLVAKGHPQGFGRTPPMTPLGQPGHCIASRTAAPLGCMVISHLPMLHAGHGVHRARWRHGRSSLPCSRSSTSLVAWGHCIPAHPARTCMVPCSVAPCACRMSLDPRLSTRRCSMLGRPLHPCARLDTHQRCGCSMPLSPCSRVRCSPPRPFPARLCSPLMQPLLPAPPPHPYHRCHFSLSYHCRLGPSHCHSPRGPRHRHGRHPGWATPSFSPPCCRRAPPCAQR